MNLVWLQREFRLSDFPALAEGLAEAKESGKVVFVYFYDPSQIIGEANSLWLAKSLDLLQENLHRQGGRLWVLEGDFKTQFARLLQEYQVKKVFYTFQVGGYFKLQQETALDTCKQYKVELRPYYSEFLIEPHKIQNLQNKPYLVFTPFYKSILAKQQLIQPLNQKIEDLHLTSSVTPQDLSWLSLPESLQKLLSQPWAEKLAKTFTDSVGEKAAWEQLEDFIQQKLAAYEVARDFPDLEATSDLSPNLHFGEINPRSIYFELQARLEAGEVSYEQAAPWLRQLVWREFAKHLLVHFPETEAQPFQAKYKAMPWEINLDYLQAWQEGRTGIPIIDAGMRELWQTGRMHNRVRMLVASFLTKNLNQSWLLGKQWFEDTLLDADPANNTMGWQWVAGCGVDAAPYYRLFNPVTQSVKFDAQGNYIKKWIPELQNLSSKAIHAPWEHLAECKLKGIVLGETYPKPLVDLKESRAEHLARLEVLKGLA